MTRSDSLGSLPQVRTRRPGGGVGGRHVLEGGIGPFLRRAVGKIGEAERRRGVEDGGDVADADVGVEQKDARVRLLAQGHGEVDGDRRLADAALRGEDADDLSGADVLGALGHLRPGARLLGQRVAGPDEHRLEAIDEGVGRKRLDRDVVAPIGRRGKLGEALTEEEQGGCAGRLQQRRGCGRTRRPAGRSR